MTEPIPTQAGDAFRALLDTLAEIQQRYLSEEFGITDPDSAAEGHRLLVHQRCECRLDIPPMRGQCSGRWEASVPAHGRPAFRAMGGQ